MADMKEVLTKLAERTKESRVAWQKTSQSDVLRATVGSLSIYIVGDNRGSGSTVLLNVVDSRGETISTALHDPSNPHVNSELIPLYEDAMKVASDDPRLDELLNALDAVPPAS